MTMLCRREQVDGSNSHDGNIPARQGRSAVLFIQLCSLPWRRTTCRAVGVPFFQRPGSCLRILAAYTTLSERLVEAPGIFS